ncbi:fimbria/pilus outer membrane usher protein [Dokdonella sp.]|uniref:fimbria/pilus outer membrane usher protein n=1 Tax=Dokdonella sp. TaxID=2291710 RepID=UPI001B162154|nr:fimbria/pilus outer membrane usher protein [Dokdonella sp.]MBO9661789.1 fimbrial biogenesis outer membrane usher protein [Dokdonella sp.]
MPSTNRRSPSSLHRRSAAARLRLACCAALTLATPAAWSDPALIADGEDWTRGTSLYLEVRVNGADTGQIAHFDERGGKLYARTSTLRQLGFVLPDDAVDPLAPADLDGVQVDYQSTQQRVAIQAPTHWLAYETTRLNAPDERVPHADGATGLLLNYDVRGARDGDATQLDASTELRAFAGRAGVFSTSQIHRLGDGTGGSDRTVRLDSSWQLAFPDSMLRLSVGDTTTGALDWTRPTYIGGVQIGRDFGLQPDRVITPLPAFFGEATVPSTVDLYVGGMRQYSGSVPPGPFELTTIPTVNGAGVARVVLTDALGRSRSYELPFYGSRQLLQAGLSDWSAGLGFVRQRYGMASWDYAGQPMGSANLRYGWSDRLTLETHAEGSADVFVAGGGGALQLGSAGILGAAAAHSTADGRSGSLLHLGYDWTDGRFAVGLESTRTFGDYRDVAARYGPPPARVSERAVFGFNSAAAGSFAVGYVHLRYPGADDSRYASAYWSRTFGGRVSLNVGLNRNLDEAADRSAFATLVLALDRSQSVNAGLQRARGRTSATVDAGRPVPADGGFGWRVQARGGDAHGGLAEVGWLGDSGQWTGGAGTFGGEGYAYAEASGSLIRMGDHTFAARRVEDAFAVVSTDGVAEVPVRLENRPIGRTDDDGMLLVTRLQAYQRNQLSIDPMDLPATMRIDRVEAVAVPRDRAGTLVRFAMKPVRAAELILHDAGGHPLALGSRVQVEGRAGETPVGYDGAVYLDDLDEQVRLRVRTPEGRVCRVQLDLPRANENAIRLGPLPCRAEEPR